MNYWNKFVIYILVKQILKFIIILVYTACFFP